MIIIIIYIERKSKLNIYVNLPIFAVSEWDLIGKTSVLDVNTNAVTRCSYYASSNSTRFYFPFIFALFLHGLAFSPQNTRKWFKLFMIRSKFKRKNFLSLSINYLNAEMDL